MAIHGKYNIEERHKAIQINRFIRFINDLYKSINIRERKIKYLKIKNYNAYEKINYYKMKIDQFKIELSGKYKKRRRY